MACSNLSLSAMSISFLSRCYHVPLYYHKIGLSLICYGEEAGTDRVMNIKLAAYDMSQWQNSINVF